MVLIEWGYIADSLDAFDMESEIKWRRERVCESGNLNTFEV